MGPSWGDLSIPHPLPQRSMGAPGRPQQIYIIFNLSYLIRHLLLSSSMYLIRTSSICDPYLFACRNCEDIAMSLLVANATSAPPIWVKGKCFASFPWVIFMRLHATIYTVNTTKIYFMLQNCASKLSILYEWMLIIVNMNKISNVNKLEGIGFVPNY